MPNEVLVRPRPRRNVVSGWLLGSRRAGSVSEQALLTIFVVGLLALGLALARWPDAVPISFLFPTVVVAGVVLRPRPLVAVYALAFVLVGAWVPNSGVGLMRSMFVAVSMLAVMALMVFASVSTRSHRHPRVPRGPHVRRAARPHRPGRADAGPAARVAGVVVHPVGARRALLG